MKKRIKHKTKATQYNTKSSDNVFNATRLIKSELTFCNEQMKII